MKNIQEIVHPATFPSDLIAPINDEMEISVDQIRLLDLVGEGAFGRVRKGILLHPVGTYTEVAVKMLKGNTYSDGQKFKTISLNKNIFVKFRLFLEYNRCDFAFIILFYCSILRITHLQNMTKAKKTNLPVVLEFTSSESPR